MTEQEINEFLSNPFFDTSEVERSIDEGVEKLKKLEERTAEITKTMGDIAQYKRKLDALDKDIKEATRTLDAILSFN